MNISLIVPKIVIFYINSQFLGQSKLALPCLYINSSTLNEKCGVDAAKKYTVLCDLITGQGQAFFLSSKCVLTQMRILSLYLKHKKGSIRAKNENQFPRVCDGSALPQLCLSSQSLQYLYTDTVYKLLFSICILKKKL